MKQMKIGKSLVDIGFKHMKEGLRVGVYSDGIEILPVTAVDSDISRGTIIMVREGKTLSKTSPKKRVVVEWDNGGISMLGFTSMDKNLVFTKKCFFIEEMDIK